MQKRHSIILLEPISYYKLGVICVKFIVTYTEYDLIDAETVEMERAINISERNKPNDDTQQHLNVNHPGCSRQLRAAVGLFPVR